MLALNLELKHVDDGEQWLWMGPFELHLGAGDRIQILVSDMQAQRVLRNIVRGVDSNWFGSISLEGVPGTALGTSDWLSSRFLGELSSIALPDRSTVLDLLSDTLRQVARQERRTTELAEEFNLKRQLDSRVAFLSLSERQRLNVLMLYLVRPRLIMVDATEPVAANNRALIREVLRELTDSGSALMLLSSSPTGSWKFVNATTVRLPVRLERSLRDSDRRQLCEPVSELMVDSLFPAEDA